MKRFYLLFFLLISSVLLTSCTNQKYSEEIWGKFDTVITVDGYFESEEEFNRASSVVNNTLTYYDSLLNIYKDADFVNLKTVNESGGEALEISKDLYDFLIFFKKVHLETDGACSMTFGSVTKIWKEYISNPDAALPTLNQLEEANLHNDINKILLQTDPYRVTLLDSDMRIDAGAVAKGWAADRLKEALIAEGFENLIVNLGGNVIALGTKNGENWSIGVRNPEGGTYLTVGVRDTSVVTSGIYERGREENGVLYHHIISPNTLFPSSLFSSVTVISESSAIADALSTALFVMSVDEGKELLLKYPQASAMWIDSENNACYTDNFPK